MSTPYQSLNPATGEVLRTFSFEDEAGVDSRMARAHQAHCAWRAISLADRGAVLGSLAAGMEEAADDLARLVATEMGKPVGEGRAEARKCATLCRFFAANAERFLAPEAIETGRRYSAVRYEPIGIVFGIMPWNFPLWQVFRAGIPAVMAGNAYLFKHAPNVPQCALRLTRIAAEAGVPDGLLDTLLIPLEQVERVIGDRRVAGVTLTGSSRAGRAVAALAGQYLKKCVLELGGNDPYLVFGDADLDDAVEKCAVARLRNGGQSCIAAKRFLVEDSVAERFEEKLTAHFARIRMGDPLNEETDLGPLARLDLRDELDRQVRQSVAAGARCRLGGAVDSGPGFFYPATVLTGVRPGMSAFDEELFGPVASVTPFTSEAEAIELANQSPYGLGAAVFTGDSQRGMRIAETGLQAGNVAVNDFVRSDPRIPFGGVKESGFGRELGLLGIREFTNAKAIIQGAVA